MRMTGLFMAALAAAACGIVVWALVPAGVFGWVLVLGEALVALACIAVSGWLVSKPSA